VIDGLRDGIEVGLADESSGVRRILKDVKVRRNERNILITADTVLVYTMDGHLQPSISVHIWGESMY